MSGTTLIPFGPQHPVFPEPLHFDLRLEDETIVDAVPQIGYVHRGLELLVDRREFQDYVFVAERICGICSFMHGMGYCESIETMMGIEVPERARRLRTFWAELSRIHSHLLWLGLAADAFGFENLFMACWRSRELVLDIIEETTGGRVIFGSAKVGGVRRDVPDEVMAKAAGVLSGMKGRLEELIGLFLSDGTVAHRLKGVGGIDAKTAYELGAVGPMLRASGLEYDVRTRGYAAYGEVDWKIVTSKGGDSYARAEVRCGEILQSLSIVAQIAAMPSGGPIDAPVKGNPKGEAFVRLEQPRGEVVYYVRADGTKYLERFRARTPTFANIPSMVAAMRGQRLADLPTIVLTIDPCISCTER